MLRWFYAFLFFFIFSTFSSDAQETWERQDLIPAVSSILSDPDGVLDSLQVYRSQKLQYSGDLKEIEFVLDYLEIFIRIYKNEPAAQAAFHDINKGMTYEKSRDVQFVLRRTLIDFAEDLTKTEAVFNQFLELSKADENSASISMFYRLAHHILETGGRMPDAFALDYSMLDYAPLKNGFMPDLKSLIYLQLGRKTRMLLQYDKAIAWHQKGIDVLEGFDRGENLRHLHRANTANAYRESEKYREAYKLDTALYADAVAKQFDGAEVYQLISVGTDLVFLGNEPQARDWLEKGLKLNNPNVQQYYKNNSRACFGLGWHYLKNKDYNQALNWCKRGYATAVDSMTDQRLMRAIENCNCAYEAYEAKGDFQNAHEWHKTLVAMSDSLFNQTNQQTAMVSEVDYSYRQKILLDSLQYQSEKQILNFEMEKQDIRLSRQRIALGSVALVLVLILTLSISVYRGKKRSDYLLRNILPDETARELKRNGKALARHYNRVTVLFTDFKGFTKISERLTPEDLVARIDMYFKAFDEITSKYGIEKIKTIGDSYMAVGGLPTENQENAKRVLMAALEIRDFTSMKKEQIGDTAFEVRIGLHSGPVVAGVVGIKKFSYDVWGDTVNTAARIESNGEVGKVNISGTTYELLKNAPDLKFESRGKIAAKGKGELEMFFVDLVHKK